MKIAQEKKMKITRVDDLVTETKEAQATFLSAQESYREAKERLRHAYEEQALEQVKNLMISHAKVNDQYEFLPFLELWTAFPQRADYSIIIFQFGESVFASYDREAYGSTEKRLSVGTSKNKLAYIVFPDQPTKLIKRDNLAPATQEEKTMLETFLPFLWWFFQEGMPQERLLALQQKYAAVLQRFRI